MAVIGLKCWHVLPLAACTQQVAAAALANVDTAVVSLSGDGSCAAEAAMLAAAEDAVSEVDSLPRCHTESTPCSQHKRNPMQPSKAAAACSDKLDSHLTNVCQETHYGFVPQIEQLAKMTHTTMALVRRG